MTKGSGPNEEKPARCSHLLHKGAACGSLGLACTLAVGREHSCLTPKVGEASHSREQGRGTYCNEDNKRHC